jgi:hypothetical protein
MESKGSEIQRLNPTDFIKVVMATKKLKTVDLAKIINKTPSNISMLMIKNQYTLKTFNEFLVALDEEILITLKNGNKFILEINK